jgi:propionate catabolism operon transcriptional regulator
MNSNIKPIRIGIIASSSVLSDVVQKIIKSPDKEIQIFTSTKGLEESIPEGKKMEENGVEVIISRLGSAGLLMESLRIPVLSIPLTSFEILKSLRKASTVGRKIFFPVFGEEFEDLNIMQELLKIKLSQKVYHDSSSLISNIISAQAQGFDVCISTGGIATKCAFEIGIKSIELDIPQEALVTTIESAKSVVISNRNEKEKAIQYQSILESTSEGIILTNADGKIIVSNKTAKNYLNIGKDNIQGHPTSLYLSQDFIADVFEHRKKIINQIDKINGKEFIFNYYPVMSDEEVLNCVITFDNVSSVIKAENVVRRSFTKNLSAKYNVSDFIYQSKKMKKVLRLVSSFSSTDSTVLVTGETGTGKELISHSIHNLSNRKNNPFVSINCAALPEHLLESELFGYEEGAFTGSKKGGKVGLFELAHNGTLLLDEIAATPKNVQVRLLRVLQEREVMRIGGTTLIPINVRIIANANQDLSEDVNNNKFREDLYFRLNVLQIKIAPLRERIEDIPLLTERFLENFSKHYKRKLLLVPKVCIRKLMNYPWPGNVRQLMNFLENIVLFCGEKFEYNIFEEQFNELISFKVESEKKQGIPSLKERLRRQEKENQIDIIEEALRRCQHKKVEAAALLGISRTTLWKKMKAYGMR